MNRAAESYEPEETSPAEPRPPLDAPPATAHLIAMTELEPTNGAPRSAGPLLSTPADLHNPLRNIKARLTVSVGSAEVTVGDLLDAKEQQVLRLDRTLEQPVDVLLEGHVVARGVLVAVDDHFAVRITEVPVSLDTPLASPRKS